MKKAYLKWLIPIIALYLMVGITCLVFGGYYKKEILETELSYMAEHYRKGISETDMVIKTVVDYNDAMAVYFVKTSYANDKEDIVKYLSYIAKNDAVEMAAVCDLQGNGFNNRGSEVSFAGEEFFEEIVNVYSNGGKGVLPVLKEGIFSKDSIVIVNRVDFKDRQKGYLISCIRSNAISEKIFEYAIYYDKVALVSLNGRIMAGQNAGTNLFEDAGLGLREDAIKLSISQKKDQITRAGDTGYMIMIPFRTFSGSLVAIISDEKMDEHPTIRHKMEQYYKLIFIIFVCILIYVGLNYFTHNVWQIISRKRATREKEKVRRDEMTGLYNETGILEEVRKYVLSPANSNGGVLFAIRAQSLDESHQDRVIKELAERLPHNFRLSDILGRGKNGDFIIFLKDIQESKDIRKQTDELQLLLYDFKTDLAGEDIKVRISAGRAIYPKDGSDAAQILASARKAMEESGNEGQVGISFYK